MFDAGEYRMVLRQIVGNCGVGSRVFLTKFECVDSFPYAVGPLSSGTPQ